MNVEIKLSSLIESLGQALDRLAEALQQPKNPYMRDACIQRFEFSFELCWKALKAYAESEGLAPKSPRESIRVAFQMGLIPEDPAWFKLLEDRNLLSHTYQEETAEEVYGRLSEHHKWMKGALTEMNKRRNNG